MLGAHSCFCIWALLFVCQSLELALPTESDHVLQTLVRIIVRAGVEAFFDRADHERDASAASVGGDLGITDLTPPVDDQRFPGLPRNGKRVGIPVPLGSVLGGDECQVQLTQARCRRDGLLLGRHRGDGDLEGLRRGDGALGVDDLAGIQHGDDHVVVGEGRRSERGDRCKNGNEHALIHEQVLLPILNGECIYIIAYYIQ